MVLGFCAHKCWLSTDSIGIHCLMMLIEFGRSKSLCAVYAQQVLLYTESVYNMKLLRAASLTVHRICAQRETSVQIMKLMCAASLVVHRISA